jgi:choline dehydrogenase-like flavoprotein
MAAASLRTMAGLEALAPVASHDLTRQALVVGGGAAGMAAALQLARLGIPVDLVEREQELGGQWRQIHYQPDTSDPQAALQALIGEVEGEPRIRLSPRRRSDSPGRHARPLPFGDRQRRAESDGRAWRVGRRYRRPSRHPPPSISTAVTPGW